MASNQGGSNVVLNFSTNGQVQYAQTIRQINSVMQTATREYQAQITAMGRNADMTERLRAEERKLQTQLQASSEKVRMLNEDYEAMQNDTNATADQLQRLYNQLLQAQTAHSRLEQSMEGVREGLTQEAIAAREAETQYKRLKGEAATLDAEQRRLASSFELQRTQLGDTATETARAALAQQEFTAKMTLANRAISNMEQQLDAARSAYGDNSTEVIRLETALNNARTTQQRLTNEFNNATQSTQQNVSAMDQLRAESSKLSTEQQRLRSEYQLLEAQLGANADESQRFLLRQSQLRDEMQLSERNVANLEAQLEEARQAYGDNSREVMQLEARLNNARTEVQRFSNELEEMQQSANQAEGAMDKLGSGAQALAGALPAAAIAAITESTQEAAVQLAMLETQAKNAGFALSDFENSQNMFASVNQDVGQVTEAMGNLVKAGYTTQDQLDGISQAISGAIVSYGETFTAEGLAESITTTTQLGEVTGQLTDLLEKSGVNVDDFNAKMQSFSSQQERANYITKVLADEGLSGAYDQYVKMNPEVVAAAEAQREQEAAMVELGNALRPLITAVTEFTTKIIEWANENPKLVQGLAIAAAAIGSLVAAAAILSPIITAVTSVMGLAGVSIGAIASPILIAIGVIAGLVAAIVGVIAIVKNWGDITDWLSEKWGQLTDFFSNLWSTITELFSSAISGISDFLKEWGPTLLTILTGPIGLLVKLFVDNWGSIKKKTSEIFGNVSDALKKIIQAIYDNTVGKVVDLKDKAVDTFGKLKDGITKPIEKARDLIKKAIDTIKGFFNFEFKWPKIPMPKFSIKPAGWKVGDLLKGDIPKLDIKWNAKGGIFTRPTIFGSSGGQLQGAGEAGPEAVLPLNDATLGSIGKAIAEAMPSVSSQEIIVPVTLTLDGRVLAQQTVKYTSRELYNNSKSKRRGGR